MPILGALACTLISINGMLMYNIILSQMNQIHILNQAIKYSVDQIQDIYDKVEADEQ